MQPASCPPPQPLACPGCPSTSRWLTSMSRQSGWGSGPGKHASARCTLHICVWDAGQVRKRLACLAGWLAWLPPCTNCRIDLTELGSGGVPCRGAGGTNVTVEDDPSDPAGLLCVTARDIVAGEELFMDYGPTYDRSRYAADVAADPTGANAGQQRAPEGQRQ